LALRREDLRAKAASYPSLGQPERSGHPYSRLGQVSPHRHGFAQYCQPHVVLKTLPRHQGDAAAGAQRSPGDGERGHLVVEEHRAGVADDDVEALGLEAVDLRVTVHESRW
jgi:hypothetical protein